MGLKQIARLMVVLAVAMCSIAAPASARDYLLEDRICVGGGASVDEAFSIPAKALDCSAMRFANRSHFVRTHADVYSLPETASHDYVWQTDPASFDSMLVRFTYANGEQRLIDVDHQMAVRNWSPDTSFIIPVPDTGAKLIAIDTVIERPRTFNVAKAARLVSAEIARQEYYSRSLVFALVCGLLLVPFIFDFLFLRMLRSRFIAWHAGMTLGALGFVFFNSGLVFLLFPAMPLELRYQANTITLTFAVACAVMFVLEIAEEGVISEQIRNVLLALTAFMVGTRFAAMFDFEPWRVLVHNLHMMSLVPLGIAILVAIGVAFKRRSRAAVFLLVAFVPMAIGGIAALLLALSMVAAERAVTDFLLWSLVLLVLATSAAVGDRFMVLRVERDRANIHAIKMQRMALSDALTGVSNRRAFDSLGTIPEGQALIIADIDHFKAINDERGHLMGDAVLADTATRMRRVLVDYRGADIFRLGGEEFAVVVPCSDRISLREIAESLRRAVDGGKRRRADDLAPVTISIGGALGHGRNLHDVYADADGALYRAKQAGRNRVVIAGER